MELDYRALDFWVDAFWKVASLGAVVAVAVMSRMKANRTAIATLRAEGAKEHKALKDAFEEALAESRDRHRETHSTIFDRIDAAERRCDHLQHRIDDLPRRNEFHEMSLQLASLRGELGSVKVAVQGLGESITPMAATIERVQTYLLENKA